MRKQLNINFDINDTHSVLHLLLSTKYIRVKMGFKNFMTSEQQNIQN